ncbi:hypothetical protein GT352_28025 [Streptomyces sp. SID1046]|uniref:hypothetical protein n=1 Tax=Streptomyces sp. SID1046 TaxID=2690249 RepID=UPI00136A1561|nr:hypothetical protein [Streptomyces sp. SID1046]MYV77749.1 hypothetical protein [Streptomyces sp. SID1046]
MIQQHEPTVTAVHYVVSCLPNDHEDGYLFTIHVEYRDNGLWSVKNRSQCLGTDRNWSWGFRWSGEPAEPATEAEMDSFNKEQDAWLAEHRFDLETALRLAKEHAPRLMHRGHTVAAALAHPTP